MTQKQLPCSDLITRHLLATWGETDFNTKPILFKNLFQILYTLTHAGLSLADARFLLEIELESLRNRVLGFLSNPVFETILGRTQGTGATP